MNISICLAIVALIGGLVSMATAKPAVLNKITMYLWICDYLNPGKLLMTISVLFALLIWVGHWTGIVAVAIGYGLSLMVITFFAIYASRPYFGTYMYNNTELRVITQNAVIKVQYRRVESTRWCTVRNVDDKDDGNKLVNTICSNITKHRRFSELEVLRSVRT